MTDKKIFNLSVYKDETTNTVYWDADIEQETGADLLKILKMMSIVNDEVLTMIISQAGVKMTENEIRRKEIRP